MNAENKVSRANDPAMPFVCSDLSRHQCAYSGLTIREHFAAMAITSVTHEVNNTTASVADVAKELGLPDAKVYDHEKHWDRFVALRIVRRADALIAELAKEPK